MDLKICIGALLNEVFQSDPVDRHVIWFLLVRVGEPEVSFPADVSGAPIHADLFPDMQALVQLPGNVVEPIYLRRPDAVAMVDR